MTNNNNTLSVKTRPHSNTISGGCPNLSIDTSLSRPASVRRNSEGSPSFPPPINICEPTPIEPSGDMKDGFFSVKQRDMSDNEGLSDTNDDRSIRSYNSQQQNNKEGLLGEKSKKKSRSRASSITSNIINEIKESSTIQKVASKIRSRHSTDDSEGRPDNVSSAAISVAGLSGVYLANSKKNQDFHLLFRSVPEDDRLIEEFSCALQKEILLQGHIYISESHVCFNANIFGWVTNLVIAFADIVDIEKKSTAYIIPNAIQISTDSAKHFFASFLSRDQAYDLMVDVWRLARPDLAPKKETEQRLQDENSESLHSSDDDSISYYDSDTEDSYSYETDPEHQLEEGSTINKSVTQVANNEDTVKSREMKSPEPNRRRAASEAIKPTFQSTSVEKSTDANENNSDKGKSSPKTSDEGETNKEQATTQTQLHEKTDCDCNTNGGHYPNVVMDQTYNGTVDKFYDLLFKSDFMNTFLVDNQKSTEFEMGKWEKSEGNAELVREYSYIKPLSGAIGPRSTKCYIKQEIFHQDTQKFITALSTTSTPDVPSGSAFTCKTKTCITWAGKGKTRIFVSVLVDFTKSSWLKSTIEKASIDGQQTYYKELDAEINSYIKQHPEEFGISKQPSEGKKKRREKRHRSRRSPIPTEKVPEEKPKTFAQNILSIINKQLDNDHSALNILSSPGTAHLTLVCLIVMVFVNVFIARKMAFVEQQLAELGRIIPHSELPQQDNSFTSGAHKRHDYTRQEEDELWEWLGRIDPKHSDDITEKIKVSDVKEAHENGAWDEAMINTKMAKNKLDKHMLELSRLIQKAESNLEDVTNSIKQQRNKIKNTEI